MFRNVVPAAKAVLLATTACLSLAAPAAAQSIETAAAASVRGRVVDASGAYLAAARVSAPALGLRVVTDREGLFSLNLPAGRHELVVSYPGMQDQRLSVTAPASELQTITLSEAGGDNVSEVVVTARPIVASQAAAIAQQRAADNIVSVVAADAIGRFPDQSAAAALSRVPGVAIERDQGQERYVQLRGAPERWTVVAVDGMNVLGAEERIFRFDSVPAVVIQTLEVNKTLTPEQPAEALAGRINIVTASPFDRKGFHVSGDAGYGEMALGGGPQRQFSGRVSWSGEHFGVTAALAHYRRNQTTDNREVTWNRDGDMNTADDFSFRSYSLERENNAGQLRVEYRPDRGGRIFFDSLYSEFIDREQRNQYDFQLSRALTQSPANRGPDSGYVDGAGYTATWEYGRYYDDTFTNTLGGDHPDVMGFDVSWRLNYTHTDAGMNLPLIQQNFLSGSGRLSLVYSNLSSGIPNLQLYTSVPNASGVFSRGVALDALPQTGSVADVFIPIVTETNTDSWTGQVDVARNWTSFGAEAEFKAGVKVDRRKADGNTFSGLPGATPILNALAPQLGLTWSVTPRITSGQWRSDFQRGWAVYEVDNIGLAEDLNALMKAAQAAGLYDPSKNVQPQDLFSVDEDIYAGYAQNKWRSGRWEVLAGLRVESVKVKSTGVLADGVNLTPLTVDKDYTDLFPSVHVNYDVTDDIKARVALIRGVARPSFGEIRTSVSINDVSETISGGNPNLEPERAWGLDAALEWYLPGAGLASISAFYRKVDDVIFDATTKVRDDSYDANGYDRTGYNFTTTLNGSDGKMGGVEIAYLQQWRFLPAPLDGFGFQGNVTFLDGDFKTPDGTKSKYPGLSNTIVNASIFYENYGLSARLSYQWRDAWLDEPSVDATDETYWAANEQLDLSLRYQVRDGLTLYFDANNLTDELGQRYQGRTSRPIETEGVGRRYMAGVRFNF
ncbi:TonB-dependent receptor [Phenylobacterium sp.]|uniref:TonB-dependent receptor n=1 Tax=Phenylobacterium sp. TaxID=1871053 RepID=UPI0035B15106